MLISCCRLCALFFPNKSIAVVIGSVQNKPKTNMKFVRIELLGIFPNGGKVASYLKSSYYQVALANWSLVLVEIIKNFARAVFFPCVGQPASNLLYAHLLWASSNHTGAVWHYRRALEVQPELQDAFNTLRALRCYLKYHQAAQSAAPVETPTTPLTHNCIQKPASGNGATGGQTESRVICKTVGTSELFFLFSLSFFVVESLPFLYDNNILV